MATMISPVTSATSAHSTPVVPPVHLLSESECNRIATRLKEWSQGGGTTDVAIQTSWHGNVRWARNLVSTAGEVRNDFIWIERNFRGATTRWLLTNDLSDAGLLAGLRAAERIARLRAEERGWDLVGRGPAVPAQPSLFGATSDTLDSAHRADVARTLVRSAVDRGMMSTGYIEVASYGLYTSHVGAWSCYVPFTQAQYSVTVRDPQGTGSGWAGQDHVDWGRIDAARLSQIALEKGVASRNPARVEPGRYTVVLEPQAVCDFVGQLVLGSWGTQGEPLDYTSNTQHRGPFTRGTERSPLTMTGEQVVDPRVTIVSNPDDPTSPYPVFDPLSGRRYQPVTWIERGILKTLSDSPRGGPPNSHSFSMLGGENSVHDMISSTRRGLLVTRFQLLDLQTFPSVIVRGYTRDGLWLIENGAITKPVKNLVFTEGILFALNNVEMVGPAQRVFHPMWDRGMGAFPSPVTVPSLKIRDFSFTRLTDAV